MLADFGKHGVRDELMAIPVRVFDSCLILFANAVGAADSVVALGVPVDKVRSASKAAERFHGCGLFRSPELILGLCVRDVGFAGPAQSPKLADSG